MPALFSNLNSVLDSVERIQTGLKGQSDAELLDQSKQLGFRARGGEKLHRLIPEAFALVSEAAFRTLGIRHYESQLLGGLHMAKGHIIEMETGQGKTLTATLPLYLYALHGRGCHLATSNDYLAARDAETMGPLFRLLGLRVGVVLDQDCDDMRKSAYACDVTYGTSSQFGFDFLRDRMKRRAQRENPEFTRLPVQRDLFLAVVDEADALLIDEANTPLIIGAEGLLEEDKQAIFRWAASVATDAIEKHHYTYRLRERQVELLRKGRDWVRQRAQSAGLTCSSVLELYERVEIAIRVHRDLHKDIQYVVCDGKVVLVNESTGRLGIGREWQEGVHQAIQAVECLEITPPTTHAGKITIQGLFLSYDHCCGMTGTGISAASEVRKVYKKRVIQVAPHSKSRRKALPTRYFSSEEAKLAAIQREVAQMHALGRPVLIGTRSVEKSDALSQCLSEAGLPHVVLNAREHKTEAEIISKTGGRGHITVATGMAGRGTDVKLKNDVLELGGLHVILAEYHDSVRQDRQLLGRTGRQGEPGTYRQFLSLDDEILTHAFGATTAQRLRQNRRGDQTQLLAQAQRMLERRRRQQRLANLYREKRELRSIWEMGRDPLLDVM